MQKLSCYQLLQIIQCVQNTQMRPMALPPYFATLQIIPPSIYTEICNNDHYKHFQTYSQGTISCFTKPIENSFDSYVNFNKAHKASDASS